MVGSSPVQSPNGDGKGRRAITTRLTDRQERPPTEEEAPPFRPETLPAQHLTQDPEVTRVRRLP